MKIKETLEKYHIDNIIILWLFIDLGFCLFLKEKEIDSGLQSLPYQKHSLKSNAYLHFI